MAKRKVRIISADELAAIKRDMDQQGQMQPLVIRDATLVDGRSQEEARRFGACEVVYYERPPGEGSEQSSP